MKQFVFTIFILLLSFVLSSCGCKEVEDRLVDNYTISLFPYSDNQEIQFQSENLIRTLKIIHNEHMVESKSVSTGKAFSRSECYTTDRFNILLSENDGEETIEVYLYPEIPQGHNRRSSYFTFDGYGCLGYAYKSSEYVILDTITIGHRLFENVLVLDNTIIPDGFLESSQMVRFLFAPRTGLVRMEERNGRVWDIIS